VYTLSFLIDPTQEWILDKKGKLTSLKKCMSIKELAPHKQFVSERSSFLISLLVEANKIKFNERPNYGKLRFLLQQQLLENDIAPEKQFSWASK